MLVGTKQINSSELRKACKLGEDLVKYAMDLVPPPMRHIQAVVSNQKYLVALNVRNIIAIPWKQRKELCEYLLNGVYIKGVVDTIYDYKDILTEIDAEQFKRYLDDTKRH